MQSLLEGNLRTIKQKIYFPNCDTSHLEQNEKGVLCWMELKLACGICMHVIAAGGCLEIPYNDLSLDKWM